MAITVGLLVETMPYNSRTNSRHSRIAGVREQLSEQLFDLHSTGPLIRYLVKITLPNFRDTTS